MPQLFSLVAVVLMLLWAPVTQAQEPDELSTLQTEILDLTDKLMSEDCTVSCVALESMIRAVKRICELDDGAACEAARDKLAAAVKRVRQACPDCHHAEEREDEARASEDPDAEPPMPSPPPTVGGDAAESPPASDARGGCAGCNVGDDGRPSPAPWALLALIGAAIVRQAASRRIRRRA